MRRIFIIVVALVVTAIHWGCGSVDGGVASERTGILFINDSIRDVDVFIEGCDEFHLPARQGDVSSRYTARCESTEDVVWTVRAYGEWVYREGTPPVMQSHEHFATARSGDTVYIRNSYQIFGLDVVSEED